MHLIAFEAKRGKESAHITYLELKDILYTVEFLLISAIDGISGLCCIVQKIVSPWGPSVPKNTYLAENSSNVSSS